MLSAMILIFFISNFVFLETSEFEYSYPDALTHFYYGNTYFINRKL